MPQLTSRPLSAQQQVERLLLSAQRLVRGDCFEAALEPLNQALKMAPTAEIYDYRGVVLSLINRIDDALESFAQALACTSSPALQAQIYFHRGLLYGNEQHLDQAQLDFARAAQLCPSNHTYYEARRQAELERTALLQPVCDAEEVIVHDTSS